MWGSVARPHVATARLPQAHPPNLQTTQVSSLRKQGMRETDVGVCRIGLGATSLGACSGEILVLMNVSIALGAIAAAPTIEIIRGRIRTVTRITHTDGFARTTIYDECAQM